MSTSSVRSRAFRASLAALLLGGALPARAAEPILPSVVSTAWLAEHLAPGGGAPASPAGASTVVVIDARPVRAYLGGHIPGAQVATPDNFRSTAGGVPAQLYPWEVIHLALGRLGIGPRAQVVVYGDESDIDATYVASVIRMAGVERVAVLDGGFKRWSAESRSVTTERKAVAASHEKLRPRPALATLDEVKRAVAGKGALLIDARPPEGYAAGHIPGARNRPWSTDVVPAGQPGAGGFRPDAEVKAEMESLGATRDRPIIVYCNSGHQASEVYFTLANRLGYGDVRLYNGSWLEWSMTPGLAKEASAAPAAR